MKGYPCQNKVSGLFMSELFLNFHPLLLNDSSGKTVFKVKFHDIKYKRGNACKVFCTCLEYNKNPVTITFYVINMDTINLG